MTDADAVLGGYRSFHLAHQRGHFVGDLAVALDVFGAVKRVYDQMEGMGPLLQDPKRSSIRIVLNPERMVINESQRLYTYLSLFGFPVDAVIANRVLPEEARSAYFDRWFSIRPTSRSSPS